MKIITVVNLLLILCLFGCSIPSYKPLEFANDVASPASSIFEIKNKYFTKEALAAIDDIPCVDTIWDTPFVSGVNFWSSFIGFLSTGSFRRQCVVNTSVLKWSGPSTIIHEYLHQIDDMSRDGEIDLISYVAFDCALEKLSRDKEWKYLYSRSTCARSFITDTFGIGWRSEELAYVGSALAYYQNGPDYLWKVFEKVLKKNE